MKVLITGIAGFIGFHLAKKLLDKGETIVGIDNLNNYYDTSLKYARLKELGVIYDEQNPSDSFNSELYNNLVFKKVDIAHREELDEIFTKTQFDCVINLAAQAGVRYSITHPETYIKSNIVGFSNILECCRQFDVKNLVYASSSSVYGLNEKIPFNVNDPVDHPISLYAASKKSNELMAHVYSHLYGIKSTGLRFFTVYGPWGRPDMASYIFVKSIINGEEIEVFNHGEMQRDFTYIDDIISGIQKVIEKPASSDENHNKTVMFSSKSSAPFRIYNIGNSKPIKLMDFITAIEKKLGIKAKVNYKPLQPGDVLVTFADIKEFETEFNYKPEVEVEEGMNAFVDWYLSYYGSKKNEQSLVLRQD
ncbi:MAG: NAD-dependent epimerase [Sediminibacterium magnilacihabitans]|nr:NAD-dependent epimerase [Sediminibacterium magnilacihabitans]PQV60060.1 UDP-glucuronate 4-epimerase [Sediminibacterium magnilacihabitans]